MINIKNRILTLNKSYNYLIKIQTYYGSLNILIKSYKFLNFLYLI